MSAFIVTVLKLLGSILSGGLLFQAFVASHHAKPITKISGIVVSLITLSMFIVDMKAVFPISETDETEQLYWQSVERHPSAETYRNYLLEYPEGKFKAIARNQLAAYVRSEPVVGNGQLAQPQKPAQFLDANVGGEEQSYWQSVEKQGSPEAFREYLRRYPAGKFVDLAQAKLIYHTQSQQQSLASQHSLSKDSASKVEHIVWENIESHPSQDLLRDYLKKYPKGQFADKARGQLARFDKGFQVATGQIPYFKQPVPAGWRVLGHYQYKAGLAKDIYTGLVWMRCSVGQVWQGGNCKGAAADFTWQQAMDSVAKFTYEGYSDWRLPTRQELKELSSCGNPMGTFSESDKCDNHDPVFMEQIKTVFPETPITVYWTAATSANDAGKAWSFILYNRVDFTLGKGNFNQVRLVRNENQ